jgi:hypothetical protein
MTQWPHYQPVIEKPQGTSPRLTPEEAVTVLVEQGWELSGDSSEDQPPVTGTGTYP